MTTQEEATSNVVELLLREPEIVEWLQPAADDETDDDPEPPRAA
jgi:hypothetical protein